jgi:ribonuclease HI
MIIVYTDGAARGNPGPAGYGIYAVDNGGSVQAEAYGYIGDQTNNFAEYIALIAAFNLARKKGWKRLTIRSDSQLLVRQMNGEYKVKNDVLQRLHRQAGRLRATFERCDIEHVKRALNKQADALANHAIDEKDSQPRSINPVLVRQGS